MGKYEYLVFEDILFEKDLIYWEVLKEKNKYFVEGIYTRKCFYGENNEIILLYFCEDLNFFFPIKITTAFINNNRRHNDYFMSKSMNKLTKSDIIENNYFKGNINGLNQINDRLIIYDIGHNDYIKSHFLNPLLNENNGIIIYIS